MMDQLMAVVTNFINQGELKKVENFNILNKLLALSLAKADWHDDHGDYMTTLLNQYKGRLSEFFFFILNALLMK